MVSVMKYDNDISHIGAFSDFEYGVDNIIRNSKLNYEYLNIKEIKYLDKLNYIIKGDCHNKEYKSKKIKEIYLASKYLFIYLCDVNLYDIDKYSTCYRLIVFLPYFVFSVEKNIENLKK